jgi:hypothetical protein
MKKPEIQSMWPLRVFFTGIGLIFLTLGLIGLKNGVHWIPGFSQTYGRPSFRPTSLLVVFGAIGVLIGIIPWGKR